MSTQTADRSRAVVTDLVQRARGRYLSPIASLVLFVVMFAVVVSRYDFASPTQVFLNLLVDNAYLIVLAVGMTFVILTGGIDLSVGSVVALSTVIVATTLRAGWPMPLAIVTVLVVGSLLVLLMGLVIEYFDVKPFIDTLAGMFLARGLC
ncbi:MAG: galactofuranose transport system permease protein, partial [Mycobacterium sp.]|nr:galactofuranose transport system permease protein [Mycobacterium sp.]